MSTPESFESLVMGIKNARQDCKPSAGELAWVTASEALGRAPRRYYKAEPVSAEERASLLASGYTEKNNSEVFFHRIMLSWEADEVIETYKKLNGCPPPDYFLYDEPVDTKQAGIRYPIEVFEGTLIGEWVAIATQGNFIPGEFFAESLKTMIGSIAGHRIVSEDDPDQEARFNTVLLSGEGGTGKSTAIKWGQEMLGMFGLIDKSHPIQRENIGAFCAEFGSGRAMIEGFERHARIIQIYDELASFVSGLAISGSGEALLGAVNKMYDSNDPPTSALKGKTRPPEAPRRCHNSILASSILDKYNGMFAGSSSDNSGFFQRLSIIVSEETRTVKKLKKPIEQMAGLATRLFKKLDPLDHQKILIRYTREADAAMTVWFDQFQIDTKSDSGDVRGRLQVLCQRNCSILAFLLDHTSGAVASPDGEGADRPKERVVDVSLDVMQRAIKLSNYQLKVRRAHQPVIGDSPWAICENHVSKVLKAARKTQTPTLTRGQLNKKIGADKYGIRMVNGALDNLHKERHISIQHLKTKTKSTTTYEWIGEHND